MTEKLYLTEKRYLGDAVYVGFDGYHIVLTTEDGVEVSNAIYLEPMVFDALVKYTEMIRSAR